MEFKEKQVLELFLGLIFVALLVVVVLLAIYLPSSGQNGKYSSPSVIQDSYNSNSYNENNYEVPQNDEIKIVRLDYYDNDGKQRYFYERDYDEEYLCYSSWGERSRRKDFFNNYIDEFKVYVVNKDNEGGYFEVKFYFCDYDDDCFSRTIEKYIPAKEEKVFSYVDAQGEKYKYHDWEYKVFPEKA